MAKFRTRRDSVPDGAEPGGPASDGTMRVESPALYEFLSLEEWDDGSKRRTGTALVFCEDGAFKVCLSDRADGYVAFVSSATFKGVLLECEEGLVSGSLDWRVARKKK